MDQQHFFSFLSLSDTGFELSPKPAGLGLSFGVSSLLQALYSSLKRKSKASLTPSPVQALIWKYLALNSCSISLIVGVSLAICCSIYSPEPISFSRSALFPIRILGIQLPQWLLTCLNQNLVYYSVAGAVTSKTTHAAFDNLKQLNTMVRQRYCPAESHNYRLNAQLFKVIFLVRQSRPTVGFCGLKVSSMYRTSRVLLPTDELPTSMTLKLFTASALDEVQLICQSNQSVWLCTSAQLINLPTDKQNTHKPSLMPSKALSSLSVLTQCSMILPLSLAISLAIASTLVLNSPIFHSLLIIKQSMLLARVFKRSSTCSYGRLRQLGSYRRPVRACEENLGVGSEFRESSKRRWFMRLRTYFKVMKRGDYRTSQAVFMAAGWWKAGDTLGLDYEWRRLGQCYSLYGSGSSISSGSGSCFTSVLGSGLFF